MSTISFQMTSEQIQAFSDASGGVSAKEFNYCILVTIGVLATLWLVFFVLGTYTALQEQKIDVGDALIKFCIAVFFYIAVGCMIF